MYYIYLLGNEHHGWCKIGMSKEPDRRLKDFSLPFELGMLSSVATFDNFLAALLVERKLHGYYESRRIRGEWFSTISPQDFTEKAKNIILYMRKGNWRKSEEGEEYKFGADKRKAAYASICI